MCYEIQVVSYDWLRLVMDQPFKSPVVTSPVLVLVLPKKAKRLDWTRPSNTMQCISSYSSEENLYPSQNSLLLPN